MIEHITSTFMRTLYDVDPTEERSILLSEAKWRTISLAPDEELVGLCFLIGVKVPLVMARSMARSICPACFHFRWSSGLSDLTDTRGISAACSWIMKELLVMSALSIMLPVHAVPSGVA